MSCSSACRPIRTSCSATTTSRSRATRSRSRSSSAGSRRGVLLADQSALVELRGLEVEIAGVDPRSWLVVPPEPLRAFRRGSADPALPLSAGPRLCSGRPVAADPLGPPPRRPDRAPLWACGRLLLAHPIVPLPPGHLQPRPHDDAHFARARDDVRAVPVLRAPGGDRARSTIRVMEGHSVISPDVLARYAADAAAEVPGVHTKQRRGARVTGTEVEVHVVVDYGAEHPTRRGRGAVARARLSRPDGRRGADCGARRRRGRTAVTEMVRLAGLTKLTLETAPTVCHECVWWQTRGRRATGQGPLDGKGRARLRRVGHRVLRR